MGWALAKKKEDPHCVNLVLPGFSKEERGSPLCKPSSSGLSKPK